MLRIFLSTCIIILPLAACDGAHQGTSIAINASGEDGNMIAGVDGKTGQISFNAPGVSGKLKLPKIQLDAGNFDMNGVHLYPGSTIASMNIDAHDKPGSDENGTVIVSFESPAAPATVRDWFQKKLFDAGYKLRIDGNGLAGTTDEGKAFRLNLTPAGADHSSGTITTS
jgi:hypothetical protein